MLVSVTGSRLTNSWHGDDRSTIMGWRVYERQNCRIFAAATPVILLINPRRRNKSTAIGHGNREARGNRETSNVVWDVAPSSDGANCGSADSKRPALQRF
jgi:hypothetical protein